jgi:hypothetical protein
MRSAGLHRVHDLSLDSSHVREIGMTLLEQGTPISHSVNVGTEMTRKSFLGAPRTKR